MQNQRLLECASAVVISLATVLTAWASYQSALWGGDEERFYFEASARQIRSAELRGRALREQNIHGALFVQWAQAYAERKKELATFLYERFPPPLRRAADAWLATRPLEHRDAPKSPFDMPEYVVAEVSEAQRSDALAREGYQSARTADAIGDAYTQLTVVFAMVLFFGGIAGKFQWDALNWAAVAFSILALVGGSVRLASLAVQ